jgi:periplasmic protein CpxP/Spy
MYWFLAILRVEEKSKTFSAQYCWHRLFPLLTSLLKCFFNDFQKNNELQQQSQVFILNLKIFQNFSNFFLMASSDEMKSQQRSRFRKSAPLRIRKKSILNDNVRRSTMKRFSLPLIAGCAALMLMGSMAMAQPRGGMMQRAQGEQMRKPWAEQLGLTDEQKAQVRQIMLDTRKKNIDVEAKQKLARIELQELMGADTPDQKKIDAKVDELSQIRTTLMHNRINTLLAVQKVLTPDQRKKAKELRPFGPHGGSGHFGGPGMMMRRGGFGRGSGQDMPFDEPEPDEEL